MANVTFSWTNLPTGYCWTGPQQFMTDVLNRLAGTVGDGAGIVMGSDIPAAGDRDKIWVRLNAGDLTLEGIYIYSGAWHRPHPIASSSKERMIWTGTEAELWAYDGGSGENPSSVAPTDMGGAMWEVDTDFNFRFPLGIGANNTGTNGTTYNGDPATSVAQGATGGAEKVALSNDESPDHVHCIGRMKSNSGAGGDNGDFLTGTTAVTEGAAKRVRGLDDSPISVNISADTGDFLVTATDEETAGAVAPDAHNNMPPYKAVVFAKRTARKFITVT